MSESPEWKSPRLCAWCGDSFTPAARSKKPRRFCGTSCSAKWRMRQPEILAKIHSPEVAKKRGDSKSRWFKAGSPAAVKELDRIRALNPMSSPKARAKSSRTLRAMGHKPSVRGGNGKGMTVPQAALLGVLAGDWRPEYVVPMGGKRGLPTCYKLDLAWPARKIAIEVDGHSHRSRKEQDQKKDAALLALGWIVLRFWNWDILNWITGGMQEETAIFQTLQKHRVASKNLAGAETEVSQNLFAATA